MMRCEVGIALQTMHWSRVRNKMFPPVGCGDGVEVGPLPVVYKGVRLPNLVQHLNREGQRILYQQQAWCLQRFSQSDSVMRFLTP